MNILNQTSFLMRRIVGIELQLSASVGGFTPPL
jgi:hypothetical protein